MWSKIFGSISCMQEPEVGGILWKGAGLPAMFKMIQSRKKKIFRKQDMHSSKNFSRNRKSVRGNHRNINHLGIWKKKKYNSRLLAGLGMKAWNASSLIVSNQIKLTTKTRDIWPIPPGWKWLNIRRKERKKREGRGNKRKKESNNKIFSDFSLVLMDTHHLDIMDRTSNTGTDKGET